MKLTHQEMQLVVAGVKSLYKTVDSKSGEARYYADVYARLTEQEDLDEISLDFITKFTDKVLERTEKLMMATGVNTEEARLRASVVNDIYVGIKEKINVKRTE